MRRTILNYRAFLLLVAAGAAQAAEVNECWKKQSDKPPIVAVANIAYQRGGHGQKLDVYNPAEGRPPFPTVLLIHGGCFQYPGKSKPDTKEYIERLSGAGYAVVSIDYRLVDRINEKNLYPASLEDVQDAVRWVRVNGAKYSLRTDRLIAFGFSSGATLAAYLGTRRVSGSAAREDARPVDDARLSQPVSAVIDFFGRMDFLHSREGEPRDELKRDCGEEFVGQSRSPETMSAFQNADVISKVDSSAAVFLIGHGSKDTAVSVEHSELLFKKLQTLPQKRRDQFFKIEGADHGFGNPGEMDQAWRNVCTFLENIK